MNPVVGVFFHWLGGLASGSFYVPYRRVRNWSWETYWLVGGFFSWIITPPVLASLLTRDLWGVISRQTSTTLGWTYLFGVLWGFGGLTFGLAMRYLGMSLGMGVALGYCAAFGTLVPPIARSLFPEMLDGASFGELMQERSGQVTLLGVGVCLVGIALAAKAGLTKEREMPDEEKKKAIKEFNFSRGIAIATFSGIMSACFAFALTAATPIAKASVAAGTSEIWSGLPKLVVLLWGGFTTNFVWCLLLNIRNASGYEYLSGEQRRSVDAPVEETVAHAPAVVVDLSGDRIPLVNNYFFSALAGTTWYMQFFFYTMGETKMGEHFKFASWTLHMASIIIFSTMWGWILHEWKGASSRAHAWITAGISTLVLSTVIIGFGTWLKPAPQPASPNKYETTSETTRQSHSGSDGGSDLFAEI